jgi:hypothetical protein
MTRWAAALLALAFASGCRQSDSRPATPPALAAPVDSSQAGPAEGLAHLPPRFGFGKPATEDEIRAWDIDVMPDGTGLPPGRGTVARGRELYRLQCASCHGPKGEGGEFEPLVGRQPRKGFPFGRRVSPRLQQTIGNYWPYATTLYDYINRAMPQAAPGTLPPDDVYSLVAYLLFLNELLEEDAVMDRESLPRVVMPARDRFVPDNRRGGPEIR